MEAKLKLEVGKHVAKAKCVEIGEGDMEAAAAAHRRRLRSQHVDPVLQRLLDLNTQGKQNKAKLNTQESLQDSGLLVLRSSETTYLFTEDSSFASHIRTLQRDCSDGSGMSNTAAISPPFRLHFASNSFALQQGVKLQQPHVTSWQRLGLGFGTHLHRRRENDEQRRWQENEHDRS